jgi:hypothetical protein
MANRPHQFKILLSDDEKHWLEQVAESRGLTASDVLRLYIRDARAQVEPRRVPASDDDFRWASLHADVLAVLAPERKPIPLHLIHEALTSGRLSDVDRYRGTLGLGRALNELTRNGYTRRLRMGYVIAERGRSRLQR